MGYDMRFYVVNKCENVKRKIEDNEFCFGEIVAQYEYCVDNNLATFIDNNSKSTNTYIYIGEDETIRDCYGDLIKDIELDNLLNYLRNDKEEYRRKLPFIRLLEGFKLVKDQFSDLRILMYGH